MPLVVSKEAMSTNAIPLKTTFDPGLTQQYTGPLLRAINKDGSFNVRRRGYGSLAGSIYILLVNLSWQAFFSIVAMAYLVVNLIFAAIYLMIGQGSLHPNERDLELGPFGRAFFFSVQTLTTVGYGSIYPYGFAAHAVAALEAALGLMLFALATGLLFSRFSRPSSKLVFSDQMVVAPYRDITALQFRVANQRSNVLMEVKADMMLMTVEVGADGQLKRNFVELPLERNGVFFLALTWTIVHPINEASPLWGKTVEDLKRMQAEVMILIRGFDDSFSQVVHTRYSYRWDEVEWSAKFTSAFDVAPEGHIVLDLGKMSATAPIPGVVSRN
jgi:inward rectifier potassium channel